MIGWQDIYNVLSAMFPLYVALILGYGSVKWWNMFNPSDCDTINRLNCYFIMPLFTFEFTTRINPYKFNHLFIAADVISKAIILIAISIWANCSSKGSYPWSVTSFSLSSLNNTLVVGVPLMRAMYGSLGENMVIQSSILQSMVWNMFQLFMLEIHQAKKQMDLAVAPEKSGMDLEKVGEGDKSGRPSMVILMKTVGLKLSKNPNSYACILGLSWAFVSYRWDLQFPSIVEGSIQIMSRAGSGVAMFCMGLFMALQDKLIDCGVRLTVVGMVMRFAVAPITFTIGSLAVGLRRDELHVAIIQAALPQAISSFVYAKEYGLHANVLSTAVIFGTIVSIPVLVSYYAVLDLVILCKDTTRLTSLSNTKDTYTLLRESSESDFLETVILCKDTTRLTSLTNTKDTYTLLRQSSESDFLETVFNWKSCLDLAIWDTTQITRHEHDTSFPCSCLANSCFVFIRVDTN
ncbi:hypothetical protein LXL04_019472 [Taraxacum kok-saghyz]